MVSLEQKAHTVKSYFDEVFMGYLRHDIETLLDLKLDSMEYGGCSAPLAMSIFSGMNQLGYLTSEKNKKEIAEEAHTEACIKEFCKDWMKKVRNIYAKSTIQEVLVNFFRHALAHQFISIASSALTRDPQQNNLLSENKRDGQKFYTLQVKILATDFIKALELLEAKIKNAAITDPDFIKRFFDRLYEQKKKHMEINERLFQKADGIFQYLPEQADRSYSEIVPVISGSTLSTRTQVISGETSMTIDPSFTSSEQTFHKGNE